MMDGEGILRQKDGTKFKGTFRQGEKNGPCVMETPDGVRFEGSYRNNERDGAFVEKDRNGHVVRKGKYRNGVVQE